VAELELRELKCGTPNPLMAAIRIDHLFDPPMDTLIGLPTEPSISYIFCPERLFSIPGTREKRDN